MSTSDNGPEVGLGVLIGRLLLLFAAVVAFVAAVGLSHGQGHAANDASARYVCPMHPQVVSPVPKDCPICNMALERVRPATEARPSAHERKTLGEVRRRVLTQVVRAPAWLGPGGVVTAVMHKESLEGLGPGQPGRFFRSNEPARAIAVHRMHEAVVPWDAAMVQVRFLATTASAAMAESTGWLELDGTARELLVVPESSVLYSGKGAYVLTPAEDASSPVARSIQVGKIVDSGYVAELAGERLGVVVVLSGLREGEQVVVADTFFLDAERRLQSPEGKAGEVIE